MRRTLTLLVALAGVVSVGVSHADYVNFETGHVHPIALTPSGNRLLVVNTPDAVLEVFTVAADGSLTPERAIPVGLEPVTVHARTDSEAWVVNNLSDSISIVDLDLGLAVKTVRVGDEPTDVVFVGNYAWISLSTRDRVQIHSVTTGAYASHVPLFGRDLRALARSPDGAKVYAVALKSGNQTTVVNGNVVHELPLNPNGALPTGPDTDAGYHEGFYETFPYFGPLGCVGGGPPSPPSLPAGIERNATLTDPGPSGTPVNSIIVKWLGDDQNGAWVDQDGSDWTHCVRYRLPDYDLFEIEVATLNVTPVAHLGTTLLDVSVNPANGRVYVSNTDARNFVRFEHPLGLRGHVVDNRLSVVDPSNGNAVSIVDLNEHIDRQSDPQTNFAERQASISQPTMLAWKSDGSAGYLAGLGSHKVFRVDGSALSGNTIFGPDRAAPAAVNVGSGPSGVALREGSEPGEEDRLYVLLRIDHAVAVVDPAAMQLLETVPLHDPSSEATRLGRPFLYDATFSSGHGDVACASCHPFGDMDGLAWELGNPEDPMVPYQEPYDNLRFVQLGQQNQPGGCNPAESLCADHDGFDPQKGPMVTQTLRGMLEPLHHRGDRPTFRSFNRTFVELLGTANLAQPGELPEGKSAAAMDAFRDFALAITFPPNPYRNVDDSLPCGTRAQDPGCEVVVHGDLLPGNPTEGQRLFDADLFFNSYTHHHCTACHESSFGSFKGRLGGVEPAVPTSPDVTHLNKGSDDTEFPVRHSDLEVPHLRNLYEKFGPMPSQDLSMNDAVAGYGLTHDGSVPDMLRLASSLTFLVTPDNQWQNLRDISSFLMAFPTGTKPSVGRQVTLPPGTPPTGSAGDESLLATLASLGDVADANRHCELTASTLGGGRVRSYLYSAGTWQTDVAGEPALTTTALREAAGGPLTFTCATLASGPRLGGDRDEDGVLNGDDCAAADAATLVEPLAVSGLVVDAAGLVWQDQSATVGSSVRYEVLGGAVGQLSGGGLDGMSCLEADLAVAGYQDARPDPPAGDGYYYLVRAANPCGVGDLGPGREAAGSLECP